jgi:hypothetical protein
MRSGRSTASSAWTWPNWRDTIRELGPPYRVDGELMRVAVWEQHDNTIKQVSA